MTPLDALFAPAKLGTLQLRNHFAMAPMTRHFASNGVVVEDMVGYYARRAAHGVGLLITEGTYIDHPAAGSHDDVPDLCSPESLSRWREITSAVHAHGGAILSQLWHVGATRTEDCALGGGVAPISPSGIDLAGEPRGRAMTQTDIDEVIEAFGRSAKAAIDAGFDGVEIHGAHGYLIDQFLWSRTNLRTDAYRERGRFGAEIVAEVRRVIGWDIPVTFRFSQWKVEHYKSAIAASADELRGILEPIARAGVTAFHVSTRRLWEPAFDGSDLTLAGWTRKLFDLPVIAVGSVGMNSEFVSGRLPSSVEMNLDRAGDLYDRGELDMVAIGRALLQDPAWLEKAQRGAWDEIAPYDPAAARAQIS